ncbi:hypothetical protein V5T82_07285 [Magnetovibrio sp. PR-2]|uniref:hypothetical protein n=1 Tax=Magnetovibrio sp. PR-2 TaxID=3120356 RepID=UPI002FCE3DBC
MCFDPITIGALTITAMDAVMVGAGLAATMQGMNSAKAQAKAQAQQYEYQAQVTELDSALRVDEQRRKAAALTSTQRALYGASGASGGSATVLDVLGSTHENAGFNIYNEQLAGQLGAGASRTSAGAAIANGHNSAVGSMMNFGVGLATQMNSKKA